MKNNDKQHGTKTVDEKKLDGDDTSGTITRF